MLDVCDWQLTVNMCVLCVLFRRVCVFGMSMIEGLYEFGMCLLGCICVYVLCTWGCIWNMYVCPVCDVWYVLRVLSRPRLQLLLHSSPSPSPHSSTPPSNV